MSCTELCPKHLSPTASIAGLKKEVLKSVVRGEL
jgi:fumarate reductase iron-sulfur subunit